MRFGNFFRHGDTRREGNRRKGFVVSTVSNFDASAHPPMGQQRLGGRRMREPMSYFCSDQNLAVIESSANSRSTRLADENFEIAQVPHACLVAITLLTFRDGAKRR